MKSYRRSFLAQVDANIDRQRAEETLRRRQLEAAEAAKPKLSRAQRKRNEIFNRKLKRKLAKDGTPAQVELLPDGGVHVTLSKEELEMRHAEDGEQATEEGDTGQPVLPEDAGGVQEEV